MYELIHLAIMGILLLCVVLLYVRLRDKLRKKKLIQICYWIATVTLCCFLSSIPYENTFLYFKTPEDAFSYKIGAKRITYQYKGENAIWLTYLDTRKNSEYMEAIYKTDKGWQIAPWPMKATTSKSISPVLQERYDVSVRRIKNNDQTFIEIFDMQEHHDANLEVHDESGVPFRIRMQKNDDDSGYIISYYKIIPLKKGEMYKLNVNGDEITYVKK